MLIPTHVLDHAAYFHRHLQCDQTGAHRHIRSRRLRSGDDDEFRVRQRLSHRNRHVAGARGKVEQQHVRIPPPHVRQELFQRTLQTRPAPQNRTVGTGEHANRNQLDTPCGHRHQHAVEVRRLRVHAEQLRQRKTVDVRVDGRGVVPERREGRRQIGAHR